MNSINKLNTNSEVDDQTSDTENPWAEVEAMADQDADTILRNSGIALDDMLTGLDDGRTDIFNPGCSIPFIDEENISKLAKLSNNPENAEKLKTLILETTKESLGKVDIDIVDQFGENAEIDLVSAFTLIRAMGDNKTTSPERRMSEAIQFIENIGYKIPLEPNGVNLEMIGDNFAYSVRSTMESVGLTDEKFRHAVFDHKTQKSLGDQVYSELPDSILHPSEETYDYWDKQSKNLNNDAFPIVASILGKTNMKDAIDKDGTLSSSAFSEDSKIFDIAINRSSTSGSLGRLEQLQSFKIMQGNIDRVHNNRALLFLKAAEGMDDESIMNIQKLSYNVLREDKLYHGNNFDENNKPTDKFWQSTFNFHSGKYVKNFSGYEEHFTHNDLAYLELSDEKRQAIDDFLFKGLSSEERNNFAEESPDLTLGMVKSDGTLSEKFYNGQICGNIMAENVASLFGEQTETHLSKSEISYINIPVEYRQMVIDYHSRLQEDDKELKIEDVINEYFDEDGPKKDFYQLTFSEGRFDLINEQPIIPIEEMGLTEFQSKAVNAYTSIKDEELQQEFVDFVVGEVKDEREVPEKRLLSAPQVLRRLYTSNASEIVAHRSAIASELLHTDVDDDEKMFGKLDEIEDIFLRNGVPMAGKSFSVFSILHNLDNLENDFYIKESNNRISPALKESVKESSERDAKTIIYNDLLKSYLGSSIHTAEGYANLLERFNGIETDIKTPEEALEYSKKKIAEAHARNIEASKNDLKLEAGDLVKGVGGINYLGTILQNGSNAREFLGEGAGSDLTPLDTDMSRVFKDAETFKEGMDGLECNGYGPIYFVLKGKRDGEERFQTTRRSPLEGGEPIDSPDLNSDKLEAFYTGAIGEHHYGIRTGFAASEIDGIVVEKTGQTAKEVGLEVALNGFYIPVYDTQGKCIFTPKDYDKLRHEMSGLGYYEGITSIEPGSEFSENSRYEFAEDLSISGADIEKIAATLPEARKEVDERHQAIDAVFANALNNLGLDRRDSMDLMPGSIQIIDTGSTGRGTNVPHDGDYDYIFKIDNNDRNNPENMDRVRNAFLESIGKSAGALEKGDIAGGNIIRVKNVNIPGIDQPIDIDITFEQKTTDIQYSTDEALKHRIAAMRVADIENGTNNTDLALANIIFAKSFFKSDDVHAYKPGRSDNTQGGLGGVGVENWILRNGGSFDRAARSFVEAARKDGTIKDFKDFQAGYQIFDFGENHMTKYGSKHDNFVSRNMSAEGYQRIAKALIAYVDSGTLPDGIKI